MELSRSQPNEALEELDRANDADFKSELKELHSKHSTLINYVALLGVPLQDCLAVAE